MYLKGKETETEKEIKSKKKKTYQQFKTEQSFQRYGRDENKFSSSTFNDVPVIPQSIYQLPNPLDVRKHAVPLIYASSAGIRARARSHDGTLNGASVIGEISNKISRHSVRLRWFQAKVLSVGCARARMRASRTYLSGMMVYPPWTRCLLHTTLCSAIG